MGEYLFSKFDPVSTEQWKEKIRTDLKGKDYDETLVWDVQGGIRVQPFYDSSDLESLLRKYDQIPGNITTNGNDWTIIAPVLVEDAERANSEALEALMHGAGGIRFDLLGKPVTKGLVQLLLKGIHSDVAPVSITNYSPQSDLSNINDSITMLDDVLMKALRGNDFDSDSFRKDRWPAASSFADRHEAFTVDGYVFKDAGANIVQELAYALAIANEYLSNGSISGIVCFKMAVSGNFFFEIAKLRALRRLWEVLSAQYTDSALKLQLESQSSVINKSLLDPHANMLRNTTECMAAALGGSDGILIQHHDAISGNSEESKRWARNISLILKNEAYLDKVADPAHGSYYIEKITDELCEAAWDHFKHIETEGGFTKVWQSGVIESEISVSLSAQMSDLAFRKSTLIGVNDYPNDKDHPVGHEERSDNGLALPPVRLAAKFEKLRYAAERHLNDTSRKPVAYLLSSGKPAIRKARINYASNLLGCAGIGTYESDVERTIEEEIGHIKHSNYNALVICSDNESWPELLPELKGRFSIPLILAGDPARLSEELREIPDHAIYMGCNVLQSLTELQRSLFA